MIRRRRPVLDDQAILHLIRTELIPISSQPDSRMSRNDYVKRMKRGRTYVWRPRGMRCQGFIHLLYMEPIVWIDLLAVHPRTRGRGIGSSLLGIAEQYARFHKAASLSLYVDMANSKATRFYERNGYAITAYIPHTKCYRMEKRLP